MTDPHVHRFGPDHLCVCGASPTDELEAEVARLTRALNEVLVSTNPYRVAREALERSGR